MNLHHLLLFCTVQALRRAPEMNAAFRAGRLHPQAEIHLGFACDTERGLLVPVVKNAQALEIAELARRVDDLTSRAVAGRIAPDDLSGATFTVTNLGSLGIESFTPILTPPQVGILGVGAIHLRPVRREGTIEFVDSIGLSLTCDHQVVDGAPGARFLKLVKEQIENVERLVPI